MPARAPLGQCGNLSTFPRRSATTRAEAEGDFAGGQAKRLYDLLTCPKEYRFFTAAEGASGHMERLGQLIWADYVFDWLAPVG
jgi:hypothetical protein